MSYREDGYRNTTRWVGVVFMILLLGWCASLARPDRFGVTPEAVERELVSDSRNGEIFKALKDSFPSEFEQLKNMVVTEKKSGTSTAKIAERIGLFMLKIDRGTLNAAMRAPHAELVLVRRSEIAMVRELAKSDLSSCARYTLANEVQTGGRPPELERLMGAFFAAKLRAAGAARKTPVDHEISVPSVAQWREVAALMLDQGISPEELSVFGNPERLNAALPSLQCRVGIAYMAAIDELPSDRGNLFYLGAFKEAIGAEGTAKTTPST